MHHNGTSLVQRTTTENTRLFFFLFLFIFFFIETNCGTFLTGPSGTVTSTNYPGNYLDNEYCTWQIQVPVNKKIRLDFTEFKTETGKDYLLIYDTGRFDRSLIVFDGTTYKPPPFTSSGNVLRVRFISDGATTRKGFSFNYKQVGKYNTHSIPRSLFVVKFTRTVMMKK